METLSPKLSLLDRVLAASQSLISTEKCQKWDWVVGSTRNNARSISLKKPQEQYVVKPTKN